MDPQDAEWYAKQFPVTDVEDWGKPGSWVEYGPGWAQVSTVPFRLFKGTQAEGGIRVPIIMAGVAVGRRGRVSHDLIHIMDLPATILDLAQVEHPATFAGRSVVPLEGVSLFTLRSNVFVRAESHEWLGMEFAGERAIRKGRWKMTWLTPPFGAGTWRLYRIDRDPSELQDLAEKKPGKKQELEKLWQEYADAHGVVIPAEERIPDDPEEAPEDGDEGEGEPVAAR